MSRSDVSDFLIHFTKGDRAETAFKTLRKIIEERILLGASGCIKGGFNCVCFSEAPPESLSDGLVNPKHYSKYCPFGVMVQKRWLYLQGGRPVIYQSQGEYEALPDDLRWRHVRYEPDKDPPIDFSWEREWRIHCNSLEINPGVASVVVPDASWADRLFYEHEREQEWKLEDYSLIFDEDFARNFYEPFFWKVFPLRSLNAAGGSLKACPERSRTGRSEAEAWGWRMEL